eukprot:gnl/MRDRNA2_/MRDRNA2_34840_c0_seq1.p1 gnl/MRDRNA2_/MRDRNA2_34840_c0~~gnl/MRDRNA2_/MRDRNA2_34840_c0_seq1.p1  ORF type:complete len:343 (-),score=68.84 gnl/MRDRNA2_/MRDRNA2_34840_c0_seq1:273-1301(-)
MTLRVTRLLQSAAPVTVLDGGMGHQLKKMGVSITGKVGSMRRFLGVVMANIDTPDLVRDAHLAYIDAGAEVITTNTYACVPKLFDQLSNDDPELEKVLKQGGLENLIAKGGEAAQAAKKLRPGCKVKIAGSLPPLGESYRPDLVGEFDSNVEKYKQIVNGIAPYSDLLINETMSSALEAKAAVKAALEASSDLPIWVSWTINDEKPVLRSGESIKEAVAALVDLGGGTFPSRIEGCMFNCSKAETITEALPLLKEALPPSVKLGAYANGFQVALFGDSGLPAAGKEAMMGGSSEYRDMSPEEYYKGFVTKWIEAGATTVGGCCGVFPHHIAEISKQVRAQGQ